MNVFARRGPVGLYIHIPFCRHKCSYCDFASMAGMEEWIEAYTDAVVRDLEGKAFLLADKSVASIFFGGGTPSLLEPDQVARILEACRSGMAIKKDAEITLEMNPESVSRGKLAEYQSAGVNRASIGVQSLDDEQLEFLDRIHTADQAREAVEDVFRSGFDNVSVDMMFGLPGQTMKSWMAQLREIMSWGVRHVSLYQLTAEHGTPLGRRVADGSVSLPDDGAEFFDASEALLESFHFDHYEISNYARPGYECSHNVGYWENRDYLGVGAAAHSKLDGRRWANGKSVESYIKETLRSGPTVVENEKLTPQMIETERLMLGLRLRRGVPVDETAITTKIEQMIADGMLEIEEGRLRASRRGWRLLDSMLARL